MKRILLLAIVSAAFFGFRAEAADKCGYDRKALLALNEDAFDQDLTNGGGGWRAIARQPGCELAAADLLAAYRGAHPEASPLLAWHEGQMRASAGQYAQAIAILRVARKPVAKDHFGWNPYVDATISFLQRDKPALLAARARLLAVPYPADPDFPPLKDGYVIFPAQSGLPARRMRWPVNIDVVDRLVHCFDKSYRDAYAPSCHASDGPNKGAENKE